MDEIVHLVSSYVSLLLGFRMKCQNREGVFEVGSHISRTGLDWLD